MCLAFPVHVVYQNTNPFCEHLLIHSSIMYTIVIIVIMLCYTLTHIKNAHNTPKMLGKCKANRCNVKPPPGNITETF